MDRMRTDDALGGGLIARERAESRKAWQKTHGALRDTAGPVYHRPWERENE